VFTLDAPHTVDALPVPPQPRRRAARDLSIPAAARRRQLFTACGL